MTLYAKQKCPDDQHLMDGLNCVHCGEVVIPIKTKCRHGNIIDPPGLSCALCAPDEDVKKAAAGIRRLFILRDTDQPMPSFDDMARAALEAVTK